MAYNLERETGFEPATLALARRCSTAELFPRNGVRRSSFKIRKIRAKVNLLSRIRSSYSWSERRGLANSPPAREGSFLKQIR